MSRVDNKDKSQHTGTHTHDTHLIQGGCVDTWGFRLDTRLGEGAAKTITICKRMKNVCEANFKFITHTQSQQRR